MNQFDEILKKRAREEPFPLPQGYAGRVLQTCAALEEPKPRKRYPFRQVTWAAAVLALMIVVPNVSPAAAAAMADVPVLGAIVRVITGLIWRKNASLRLSTSNPTETEGREKPIWKSGLAWCVTLYFGINSMIFYAVIGWLPTILQSAGIQSGTAGIVTSLYQVVSLAPSLLVPTLAGN